VRPQLASRPAEHILDEIRRLVDNGYREVVLTGIHLGHYGVDWNRHTPKHRWIRLSHLVKQIAELPGDFRLRLSSIEATEVTRELVQVMADYPDRVAPHLHISMQSGSDAVLRRMRRRWGSQRFIDRCRLVQDRLDRPAITTDIIVGFPGETDDEFQETIDAARAVGFSKIHIFPFSPRRGTPAAEMPNLVPSHVQQQRSRELAAVEAELRDCYYHSLVGRRLSVLVERCEEEMRTWSGTSCRYATVELAATAADEGRFVDAIAREIRGERLIAC
jgi:threonylcarbamoyladenosine tRNA methylthiotransferase MtaB